ncbi:non-ribosomal peptide synthetase [Nostoc sp. ChiQUE01b]|uniref:non-ribosomal peptide synthetase n=1 Tax=Nostoc sp. ChiQUE01b TaxID=3075376 RepID=UPI002AD3C1A9|nr:non-ribosomal peptide synthetase [Nostoc sp. ChiQUE01b]MDZ8258880.1 amino acid adenylation domain-containing protein [Nostoc sp. ChiQUE01b]
MNIEKFLAHLQTQSVTIWIDGDQLGCRAPKGVMTAAIQQELKERKTEILAFLKEAQTATQSTSFPLIPVERDRDLPLSFAQQRMWFLYQLDKKSPFYNENLQVRIVGKLSVTALEQSINEIIRRHEALRTTFAVREGIPFQAISPSCAIALPVVNLQGFPEASVQQIVTSLVRKPFDLAIAPLLRATLLRQEAESHLLILTIHHIITDGWSMGIFFKELEILYQAFTQGEPNPLPELTIQYADFALWQRQWLTQEVQQKQLDYWKQQLTGAPPLLELPTNYPRPPVQTFSGATKKFQLTEHLTSQLVSLSQKSGVTLFMTLLAAFAVLLHRYSGVNDVCIGSPFANRNRQEVEPLIGCFVNTLVLRTQIEDNPSFSQFLQQVRSVVWDAHAHQDIPFEQVVEALQPERSLGYNPLFQVVFVLENFSLDTLELPDISLTPEMVERGTSQFDLSLSIWQTQKRKVEPVRSCRSASESNWRGAEASSAPNFVREGLIGSWEYNSDLFEADTIARMTLHFQTLLETIVRDPNQRVRELPLLTESERHQLLVEWNGTQTNYPQDKCIHQLFEEQVERNPDAVAVVFEDVQTRAFASLTYQQLNAQANQLAHYLLSLGVKADALVGICVERSVEMIVGILGILKAGGAYVPLDPEYPTERLSFMLEDTQLSVILTQEKLVEKLGDRFRRGFGDRKACVICLDSDCDIISQQTQENPTTSSKADNLAYVMYTSGSTGQPKGVSIVHQSVVRLVKQTNYVSISVQDVIAQASNHAFDAATFEIWGALLNGARLVGVSKELALSPKDFAAFIRAQSISVLFLTTALFNQIAQEVPSAFNSLRHLLFGGEAVDPKWVKEVLNNGAPQRLLHVYGPTENTTFTSWYLVEEVSQDATTIPIGQPIANTQIYLLDSQLQPVPIGVPGELHIGGAGLARGYFHRPETTAEKFIEIELCDKVERLYKTGDLVRYLPDGNIEYLGRIDNQVKIRGFRIELGEIEAILSQHGNVQTCCVIVHEDATGDKRLFAYVVPQTDVISIKDELHQFLADKLPHYMMPSAFVILESLPLTTNGKVDRRALPIPDLSSEIADKYVAPRTPIEEILAQIWAQVLKVEQVGIYDNFFKLGGHSLLATQVISRLPEAFGTSLPLRSLFESPTVAQLSEVISNELQTNSGLTVPPIVPVSTRLDIPLSWAQERLWFLHQLEGESGAYTINFPLHLVGNLNIKALEKAIEEMVQRHEVLRTRFEIKNEKLVQVIDLNITIKLPIVDLQNVADPWQQVEQLAIKEAYKPFDLANDPVMRVKIWQVAQQEYVLLIAIHHIAADGWSLGIVNRELSAHYRAIVTGSSVVLPLPVQYADFTLWQRQWLTNEVLERQLSYWKQQLAGAPPLLELPTDRLRPAIQTFRGATEQFQLDSKLTSALRKLSQESGSTLFMTLLAGFVVLMSRYTGQTDLLVGSPIANRNRKEIEGLIGFFVNILALRFDLLKEPTLKDLLTQVRQVTQNAYDHQDLPFEMLVEKLQLERNLAHNPLVQVIFALQNAPTSPWDLPGLKVEEMPWKLDAVRFDLEVHFWETSEGLEGFCCYSTDLFDGTTIARMMQHFQNLLVAIALNPQQPVALLPWLTQQGHHQLLVEWNDTGVNYPQDKCIHQWFEEQVARTPDAVAVVYENQQLTYRELNYRANQVAHYLRSLGVGADVLVGLCVERSLEMVLGILGILKAGGAYVPLDPEYPQERLSFMLEDAQVEVVLTQKQLVESLPQHQARVVCLDTDWEKIAQNNLSNLEKTATSDNLAYVIYTSGSTGKPKGVLVNHCNVVRLFTATDSWYNFNAQDVWTLFHSYAFDFSVWEIWGALLYGGRLVVVPYLVTRSPESFYKLLCQEKVTILNQTPSAFRQLIQAEQSMANIGDLNLRLVIFGGEALELSSLQPWFERHGDNSPQLVNMYGITETTVHVTYRLLSKADLDGTASVIGRPIPDLQVYVLDEHQQPVPIGVPGEMYVGGAGVARGYLNRPELTQQRFISHPFSKNPQARLYKTGDKARYLPNGELEYLGRIDNQVKVRGFRIELGEIEVVLSQHPLVQESVVVIREDTPGDKRTSAPLSTSLVAYLVPAVHHKTVPQQVAQWQSEYVSDWQMLYEQAYSQNQASTDDLTFNITGWNSSYTRQPIPDWEMQEWVENTTSRILAGFPQRVLEIGCGTGLLLSRIAKHCQQYWGCDYSIAAIKHVEQICSTVDGLAHVRLLHQMADNFEGIPKAEFDTVILNSVVQYFPNVEYLLQVIEGAMAAIGTQGRLFMGDIRSLPLLEPYHAAVQLFQAAEDRTIEQWQRMVNQSVATEEELVIDPGFFIALQTRFPQITWVEIQPKGGNTQNELTQFRYDVTLHVGIDVQKTVVSWLNWQLDKLSLTQIQNRLQQEQPQVFAIRRVPNQRVQQALQIWQWLEHPPAVETLSQLQQFLAQQPTVGVNPEQFYQLGQQLGYTVHLSWWESSQDGCYDLVFRRQNSTQTSDAQGAIAFWDSSKVTTKPWTDYTNNPLRGKLVQKLVPQVREYIQQKLPDYMMPQAFVVLDALPLTLNGKVDRRALPSPDTATRNLSTGFVLPRTPIEAQLARIWSQVLGVERIGVNDNFFELGGHSLLATQVLSEINSAFGLDLSIQMMFESPTVAGIAAYIETVNLVTQNLSVKEIGSEVVEF